uniref:Uncharacterized protein n=1 Tax=Gasterosteus aculeatus TaxID=69293 RepID=G3PIJ2_GASAC
MVLSTRRQKPHKKRWTFWLGSRRWLRDNEGKVEGKQSVTHLQFNPAVAMMTTQRLTLEMFLFYFASTIIVRVLTSNSYHSFF